MPNGYLSYGIAILAVAGAIAGYFLGWLDNATTLQIIFQGLAVFGIRKSIANASSNQIGGASHW